MAADGPRFVRKTGGGDTACIPGPPASEGRMQPYFDIFTALSAARADDLLAHGLVIKAGEGMGAAILKVLKPAWTTDPPEQFLNTNGLFFSVWVDPACKAQKRARFNLHAKKLRNIKGEAFAAREFARTFRAEAAAALQHWPTNVYPKGPITLFEGHIHLDRRTLQMEASALVDRFVAMVPTIDRQLASAPIVAAAPEAASPEPRDRRA
jgi:hypothetical protein